MELVKLNTVLNSSINEEIYIKIVAQLDKDFVMSGIQYDFNNLSPDELLICLREIVEHLLSQDYSALLNLFYRMDIPQNALDLDTENKVEDEIVNLILKREFLKVQMRMKYSK